MNWLCALAVSLGALASLARADEERGGGAGAANMQASQHYEAGQRWYDEGRYDEAISEYQSAYRLKPHANVLYNIAQAYERLLDYAKSVEYFERYLREAPDGATERIIVQNRLRVLRNLPARISVTTIPEHAHATLEGLGVQRSADTPALFRVPAGDYQIALAEPGWEGERHELHAELGQPYFYQYRLKRSTAMVSIFSRPRGARVFIDDRLVGETPFAQTVEVGKHKLLLEHADYPWHREELDVEPGLPLRREVKLSKPVRSGRTELVLWSMLYGGTAGPLLVATFSSSEFMRSPAGLAVTLGASAAGLGAGFVASFLPTRDGIKVGHSSLIIGGGAWGTAIGTALAFGLAVPDQYITGLALLGGGLGHAAGILISHYRDVMPGTAAILNSGGFWGTATGALLAQSIFVTPSKAEWGWFLLGGSSLGVVAGALAAWKIELSRGHMLLIDVGGAAGGGLGLALGYAVGASSHEVNPFQAGARYALGGAVLGLLTAAVLARGYKGDLPPTEALLHRDERRGWALGIPAFRVEQALTPEGSAPRYVVELAKGTW